MGSVTIRGGVMSPRVVLGAPPVDDASGPPLPASLGEEAIWRTVSRTAFGWEYRLDTDYTTVIQPIGPASGGRYVYAAWVPSDARAGANPVFAQLAPILVQLGTLAAWWECDDVAGVLVPRLDSTPEATEVRAAWPTSWRLALPGDAEGAPTGARFIGKVLA